MKKTNESNGTAELEIFIGEELEEIKNDKQKQS